MSDLREHRYRRYRSFQDELSNTQRSQVSPGKVTLTSRLQGSSKSARVADTSVQRKELSGAEEEARRIEMARWETAALLGFDPRGEYGNQEGFSQRDSEEIRDTAAHRVDSDQQWLSINDAVAHRGSDHRVQGKGAFNGSDVLNVASRGVAGRGGPLPHREQVQAAFGRHNIMGVRTHVGGAAADASTALGARAYATGENIAFVSAPDLFLAAHEAAHVVQQRSGVQLANGVGQAGDTYEQHADAVAGRVVRGESAEALLDAQTGVGSGVQRAVQRQDSHDIAGNVLSLTGNEERTLDERSQRRLWERLAELEGRDMQVAASDWERMNAEERQEALRRAVTHFQQSEQGRRLIEEIRRDNAVRNRGGEKIYGPPQTGTSSSVPPAPTADYHAGEVLTNDVTQQALANAWPQTLFGRLMSEAQAYDLMRRLVSSRGMAFNQDGVNVIGMRAYQGGGIHDNGEPQGRVYTRDNRYDDTIFIVFFDEGQKRVQQSRGTVDPGAVTTGRRGFQVAADQQWDYRGYSRGRSQKYNRAQYDLPDPNSVRRGRYWQDHPDEIPNISTGQGRIIRWEDGQTGYDRLPDDGGARGVSALHSGGRGSDTGERVGGDSIGCSVVHGAWFPHFNESLRRRYRAATGDRHTNPRVRFTYTLIDPRMFPDDELQGILDDVAPRTETSEAPLQRDGGDVVPGLAVDIRTTAEAGVAGSSAQLPHLDTIQAGFGHHNLSTVRAHVGDTAAAAAAAIGASAYTIGDDVSFATAPDLRQAAHEAAHVVQQRGGVSLDGGVGRVGDRYEQHADAVAAAVVRGESASALLDTMAHSGAVGGSAVQRDPRTPEQIDRLIEDTVQAIAMSESGAADRATESRMRTSAGVPASYASSTQMTASHAVEVLLRSPQRATQAGVSRHELLQARRIMWAAQRIWRAIVEQGQEPDASDLALTRFTPEHCASMVHFREIRQALLAQRQRYPTIMTAVQVHLTAAADRIRDCIEALPDDGTAGACFGADEAVTTSDESVATPDDASGTDVHAPDETGTDTSHDDLASQALAATPARQLRRVAILRSPALPARWANWRPARRLRWLDRQADAVRHARRGIDRASHAAADSLIAHELAGNPHALALNFNEATLRAHVHEGQFDRFNEDMNGWNRLALQHNTERNPPAVSAGESPRTLDAAIGAATTAGGGWELSSTDFDAFIRSYVREHRDATDEQVVRAAAAHNGRSPRYPDRIWRNFQRLRSGRRQG